MCCVTSVCVWMFQSSCVLVLFTDMFTPTAQLPTSGGKKKEKEKAKGKVLINYGNQNAYFSETLQKSTFLSSKDTRYAKSSSWSCSSATHWPKHQSKEILELFYVHLIEKATLL